MIRKRRSTSQIKEEISYRVVREKLPEAWVMHEYGPDYGIDCVVELFEYVDAQHSIAETLGETFFVQLKASASVEYDIRRAYSRANVAKGKLVETKEDYVDIPCAKFQLEMPELLTVQAMGPAVPVLLLLVDVQTTRVYFVCLNDYIDKVIAPEDPAYASLGSKVIYIPTTNEIGRSHDSLIPLRSYAKRAKMYGAFGMFGYQKKEIERVRGLTNFCPVATPAESLEMLRHFTNIALRQDIWSNHDFWEPVGWSHQELTDVLAAINGGISADEYESFTEYCDSYVWHRLCNLANMYEELVREWFLPTQFGQLISRPPSNGG